MASRKVSKKNPTTRAEKRTSTEELPIGTELKLTIPRTVRKNRSHRATPTKNPNNKKLGAKLRLSEDSKDFRIYVKKLWKEQELPPKIEYGAWAIEIVAFWDRQRHLDIDFPIGDVDASVTPVMDALDKGVKAFDDDVRLGPAVLDREYDPEYPRIEVTLKRWE